MSRTIRRKNYASEYNSSYERAGKKVLGRYTQSVVVNDGEDGALYGVHRYMWFSQAVIGYREPNKVERYKIWRRMHGESKNANAWTPGKTYRYPRCRQWRQHNRQEVIRWMKCEEYETLCESNPRNCWWDWR